MVKKKILTTIENIKEKRKANIYERRNGKKCLWGAICYQDSKEVGEICSRKIEYAKNLANKFLETGEI